MMLLRAEETFVKAQEKSHVKYIFDVPEGLNALKITFNYYPKEGGDMQKMLADTLKAYKKYAPYVLNAEEEAKKCLPLVNHIGFSVDAPNKWLGTRHNHSHENEYIIGKNSTKGFENTAIIAGKWAVTLTFNSIVTEAVDCFAEVEGD